MATHPRLDMAMGRIRCDDPEAPVVKFGHGEVCFQQAGRIEPGGVGDDSGVSIDAVGGDALHHRTGVAALHEEFRHEGHVHEAHAFPDRPMLALPLAKPVLATPTQLTDRGLDTGTGVPVSAFPTGDIAEVRTLSGELVVQGRALDAARGRHRSPGEVGLIDHAQ